MNTEENLLEIKTGHFFIDFYNKNNYLNPEMCNRVENVIRSSIKNVVEEILSYINFKLDFKQKNSLIILPQKLLAPKLDYRIILKSIGVDVNISKKSSFYTAFVEMVKARWKSIILEELEKNNLRMLDIYNVYTIKLNNNYIIEKVLIKRNPVFIFTEKQKLTL